jgi:polyphosphate kinase
MSIAPPFDNDEIIRRISLDLADGCPIPGVSPGAENATDNDYRQAYFRQLFRLQTELVKLQDWVVASAEKVLILSPQREHHEQYSRQTVPAGMLVPEVY